MELPRFLTLSKSRRFLTLSKSSKTDHVVPRLRDESLKASVHVTDATLLAFQHDLRTNSIFFNINLKLDPANSDVSAFQQYFIVNGLCDEFMLELDYDHSIIAAATTNHEKQKLLVEYAENICNKKLSRELDIAEKLLNTDVTDFFTCVAAKVDNLLNATIDAASIENGDIPLVEKSSNIYLEWFSLIEACIDDFVARARIDTNEFPIENPFELIDLKKVRTLGSLFGEIYEGNSAWVPHTIQTRKYHVGSVRMCPSHKISEERIKKSAACCAASFFVTVAKSPIGRKFEASTSELQQKYIEHAKKYYEVVETLMHEEGLARARQAQDYANVLVEELGPEAERLKLAMEHDINLLPICYGTLTNHIRNEIEAALIQGLKGLYTCVDVDVSASISFANGDLARHGNLGVIHSPDLLTLRVSHIVAEYFNGHPWLSRLNIKKPEIKLLADSDTLREATTADSDNELVLISGYFDDPSVSNQSEMIIDINKIRLEPDRQDEMITLQQI